MFTLLTIIAGYYLSICLGWLTHFLLHCEIFGLRFYKFHLLAHHKKIKIANHTDINFYNIIEHLIWLSLYFIVNLVFLALLPLYYALILIATLTVYAILFYFIHDHVHFKHSFLKRYKWFRALKTRHLVHHRHGNVIRFKQSLHEECPNIAFGGPIGGIFIDKLVKADRKD